MRRFAFACIPALIAGAAAAQDGDRDSGLRRIPEIDAVLACRQEAGDAAQAACFRAAADRLEAALQTGEVAAASRQQIEAERRSGFGLPDMPDVGGALASIAGADESDRSIAVEVVEIERRFDNSYEFVTADGQRWRQSGGRAPGSFGRGPHTGVIEPGMANSYFLKLDGFSQVRVRRVE